MADRVGFEPTEGLHPRRFSRPLHSTALPPVRVLRAVRWQAAMRQSAFLSLASSLANDPWRAVDSARFSFGYFSGVVSP